MFGIHRQRPGATGMQAATDSPPVDLGDDVWMSPGWSNSYLLPTDDVLPGFAANVDEYMRQVVALGEGADRLLAAAVVVATGVRRHRWVGRGGRDVVGQAGEGDHGEGDVARLEVDEDREDPLAPAEAAPQRRLGHHLDRPAVLLQAGAHVGEVHRPQHTPGSAGAGRGGGRRGPEKNFFAPGGG